MTIGEIVRDGAVTCVYQPIVELDTGRVAGYEALARGPKGTRFESPLELFAAAAEHGLLADLDWVCRAAAVQGARDADFPRSTKLFVNVEPAALRTSPTPHIGALIARAAASLSIVVEVTERSLVNDPAVLSVSLAAIRELGMGVAIDDLGADPASLALLPFIAPDVIKLDMSLIREHTYSGTASIGAAVRADAERRGATILAEGIETEEHLERALVLGAQLGQGWMFGRPEPLPPFETGREQHDSLIRFACSEPVVPTPWALVADRDLRRIAKKRLLMPMSHHIEQRALTGDPCVVLGAFQDATHFTPATARRYTKLAATRSMVGAIGIGMTSRPAEGVRGGSLPDGHPMAGEWTVAVVGPHDAAALIARDLGDDGDDADRRFEYVITHDRGTVINAARSLMQYIAAE